MSTLIQATRSLPSAPPLPVVQRQPLRPAALQTRAQPLSPAARQLALLQSWLVVSPAPEAAISSSHPSA